MFHLGNCWLPQEKPVSKRALFLRFFSSIVVTNLSESTVNNNFILFSIFFSNANHFIFQHCKSLQPVCTVKQNIILFSAVHSKNSLVLATFASR
jgi:hypothetical protein